MTIGTPQASERPPDPPSLTFPHEAREAFPAALLDQLQLLAGAMEEHEAYYREHASEELHELVRYFKAAGFFRDLVFLKDIAKDLLLHHQTATLLPEKDLRRLQRVMEQWEQELEHKRPLFSILLKELTFITFIQSTTRLCGDAEGPHLGTGEDEELLASTYLEQEKDSKMREMLREFFKIFFHLRNTNNQSPASVSSGPSDQQATELIKF